MNQYQTNWFQSNCYYLDTFWLHATPLRSDGCGTLLPQSFQTSSQKPIWRTAGVGWSLSRPALAFHRLRPLISSSNSFLWTTEAKVHLISLFFFPASHALRFDLCGSLPPASSFCLLIFLFMIPFMSRRSVTGRRAGAIFWAISLLAAAYMAAPRVPRLTPDHIWACARTCICDIRIHH